MLAKNFRVVNNDLCFGINCPAEVIDEFTTYEEAVGCTIENYMFMCEIQQRVNGKWLEVAQSKLEMKGV